MRTWEIKLVYDYIAKCDTEVIPLTREDADLVLELLEMRLKAAKRQKKYNEGRKDFLHERYEAHKEEWKAQRRERYYREKKQRMEELINGTKNK